MYKEKKFFYHVFNNWISETKKFSIPTLITNELLSNIDSEYFVGGQVILYKGDELKYFYLLKTGNVKCYGRNYNYLVDLEAGSSFGEYQLMFDIYSDLTYKASFPFKNTKEVDSKNYHE